MKTLSLLTKEVINQLDFQSAMVIGGRDRIYKTLETKNISILHLINHDANIRFVNIYNKKTKTGYFVNFKDMSILKNHNRTILTYKELKFLVCSMELYYNIDIKSKYHDKIKTEYLHKNIRNKIDFNKYNIKPYRMDEMYYLR